MLLKGLQLYKQIMSNARFFDLCNQLSLMADLKNSLKQLKEWRTEKSNTITEALQKLSHMKVLPDEQLDNICDTLAAFHKEIGKAEEKEIDITWFQPVIALKKKVKKLQESQKERIRKAQIEKKTPSVVIYPQTLCQGRRQEDQQILKCLYRNFVNGFQEGAESSQTVLFLQYVLKELKYMFEDKPDQALHRRINSICLRLSKASAAQAKSKMLAGDISPLQLAKDKEETYFDQKTREIIRKNKLAQLQENQTGFYDSMKKAINKDACEECRYCHQLKAFCEDMKQIRASDEPMTRFMRCNACNKAWRD